MADYLVLRFDDVPTEPVEWIVVDATGAPQGEIGHGDLQAAADAAAGRRVIALVPATTVLHAATRLPVRNQAKILQALPFAMEEQLAGDVEELHFAAGRHDADGRLPVAVVQRLKMEAWLEQISAVELDLAGVYSDAESLGDMPNTTILLAEAGRATIRDADGTIAATDLASIDALLELWLHRHRLTEGEELPPPINLLVYVTPDCDESVRPVVERLRAQVESVEILQLPDGALPRMAAQAILSPGINLLQGAYARRSTLAAYWPAWRVAAILLVSLCVTLLGARILHITELNRQAARLDQSIAQAIRYTFPEVREIRDARALVDSKMRALGAARPGAGDRGFLTTLDRVAAAITDKESATANIESIDYRSGIMELRVVAPNVETLDRIRQSISRDAGLEAEIQSANPEGDGVRGRLQIRPAGA